MRALRPVAALAILLAAEHAAAQPVPTPAPRLAPPVVVEPATPPAPALEPPAPDPAPPPEDAAHRAACPALLDGRVTGRAADPIRNGPCREDSPVAITAIGEVALAREAIVTCRMAEMLASLVTEARDIAVREAGSPLASIDAGGGQECRRRNRAETGKFSEHAFANALDMTAFVRADGRRIVVEEAWPHLPQLPAEGETPPQLAGRAQTPGAKFLAAVHAAACERFTTVLGPDADEHHRNHLHFDLGCHGRTCTARVCE